jgi:hypothetical protein
MICTLFFPNIKAGNLRQVMEWILDSVGLEYGACKYNNDHHLTQRFYKDTM